MICAPYKELIIPEKLRSPNWDKAIAWLREDSWKDMPPGTTELDGKRLYVTRSVYMSKKRSERRYESHRINVDVHMVLKGSEAVFVCQRDVLKLVEPYSPENDSDLLDGEPDNVHRMILGFPMVLVLFPWDIHMTSLAPDDMPGEVEKLVFKVAI